MKLLDKVAAKGDIEYFDYLVSRGADPHRSLALHCASECRDPQKTSAVIDHLLDVHKMDIEADNEGFRDFILAACDRGTPLNSAVYHHNIPAMRKLLQRGANPEKAVNQVVSGYSIRPWMWALGVLLDAGADPNHAFEDAVECFRLEAARVCLKKGADPTVVLSKHQARAASRAAGTFVREWEEAYPSSDDDEQSAVKRKEMKDFVRLASEDFVRKKAAA